MFSANVLGSIGADGRCTMCNRHHEDFAHVIDVSADGNVHTSHSHIGSHGVHRSIDNLSREHGAESRSNTPISNRLRPHHHVHITTATLFNFHDRNLHHGHSDSDLAPESQALRNSGNIHHSDIIGADDDDIDVDVSGNDLIPPSYDLSPPSYDEALTMPTPDAHVTPTTVRHLHHAEETHPLYQNIESNTAGETGR